MLSINRTNPARCFSCLFLIVFFGLTITSCTQRHQTDNTLIVGLYVSGYPYASINQNGVLDGFNIDFAYKLAKKIDKKIVFKDMPVELLQAAINMEQVDLIGFSFGITKKKLETMDMVDIYGKPENSITLLFWQKIPNNLKTLADLKKQSSSPPVVVKAESPFAEILEDYGINNVMTLEQYTDLILPIKYGQALALVVGPRHALALKKQYPEIKILKIPLDKPWAEGVGLGVKKGNVKLKEQLEKAVKELKEDGTIAALKQKWFGEGAQ